jgi:G:T-mismatch repair DNA endonuclease (very short patch repair protein)
LIIIFTTCCVPHSQADRLTIDHYFSSVADVWWHWILSFNENVSRSRQQETCLTDSTVRQLVVIFCEYRW